MKCVRILARIRATPWASTPAALSAIAETLSSVIRGDTARTEAQALRNSTPSAAAVNAGTAVIPIHGILGKNLSLLETECGGCDVDSIASALAGAVADPAVERIVLDFDSPGGAVTGIPELRAQIAAATSVKTVIAYSAGEMCSGAYWLATGAGGILCAPTAVLGSVGVYMALVDECGAWEKQGLKLELVKAGDFKGAGLPGRALSADERALLQGDVNNVYAMFVAAVRSAREKVAPSSLQGQVFRGEAAVAAGLADELVPTLAVLLASLATPAPAARRAAAVKTPTAAPAVTRPISVSLPAVKPAVEVRGKSPAVQTDRGVIPATPPHKPALTPEEAAMDAVNAAFAASWRQHHAPAAAATPRREVRAVVAADTLTAEERAANLSCEAARRARRA